MQVLLVVVVGGLHVSVLDLLPLALDNGSVWEQTGRSVCI